MPPRLTKWLLERTITPEVVGRYGLHWENGLLAIPVRNEAGTLVFHKYRRDPDKEDGPKYLYEFGSKAMLFGAEFVDWSQPVVLCEGELDVLALVSHGFQAVSSTGGCHTFRAEWLEKANQVYICYDSDEAGVSGALKVHYQLPNSLVVTLSHGKDVTEFFVSGGTREGFERLLAGAVRYSRPPRPAPTFALGGETDWDRAKSVPISHLLKFDNRNKTCCLWHREREPSLTYYPKTNSIYCFGCGKWGSAIDVVALTENCSLREAVDILLAKYTNYGK